MKKMIIKKTNKCDAKAKVKNFTEHDVLSETLKHQSAVINVSEFIIKQIRDQVANHDTTKLGEYLPMFTEALKTGFVNDWWNIHKNSERHHLNDRCPEDVNLIDVIEMLVDCVCAGKASTGDVYPMNISNEILQKAVANTVELLKDNIEVEE